MVYEVVVMALHERLRGILMSALIWLAVLGIMTLWLGCYFIIQAVQSVADKLDSIKTTLDKTNNLLRDLKKESTCSK